MRLKLLRQVTYKHGVRRISAAENLQREDLSAIETIEGNVEMVDVDLIEYAELIEVREYASMGEKPADRVKTLLGQLDSVRRSQVRGSDVSGPSKALSHKFVGQVEKIFKNLPKPLEWRSFYNHDLPLLMDISEEAREVSIQPQLSENAQLGVHCYTLFVILQDIISILIILSPPASPERERPARLALRSIAGRWRAGMVKCDFPHRYLKTNNH